jgi:hypothetical protein
VIPLAAWIRGVPYVTLVRMAANLGIGVLVAQFRSSATSSTSPGRPIAATIACSAATWANRGGTPGATGLSFCSGRGLALVFAIPVVLVVWLSVASAS